MGLLANDGERVVAAVLGPLDREAAGLNSAPFPLPLAPLIAAHAGQETTRTSVALGALGMRGASGKQST